MKQLLGSVLASATVLITGVAFAVPTVSTASNSSTIYVSPPEWKYSYGNSSGTFVYFKKGSTNASIRYRYCNWNSICGPFNTLPTPTTSPQTYEIYTPNKRTRIAFEGKVDNANTRITGTLTQD